MTEAEPEAECPYEIGTRLGAGGFGQVFLVQRDGNLAAVKMVASSPIEGISAPIEIDVMSRLRHPHLQRLIDLVPEEQCEWGGLGLVMPLASMVLDTVIPSPDIAYDQRVLILFQMVTALEFLHQQHILHLDLKPENILLDGKMNAIVSDFGLCLPVDDVRTGKRLPHYQGTPIYSAPEHLQDQYTYTGASDVWSLGLIMVEVLSRGRSIYPVISIEDMLTIVTTRMTDPMERKRYLAGFLTFVPSDERQSVTDLLSRILSPNPETRLSMTAIRTHAVFTRHGFGPIPGEVKSPHISDWHGMTEEHRAILDELTIFVELDYTNSPVETYFLAMDLAHRMFPFTPALDTLRIVTKLCWVLASKITQGISGAINLNTILATVPEMKDLAPNLLRQIEVEIVRFLEGILYRPNFYTEAQTRSQLILAYPELISGDYLQTNPRDFIAEQPVEEADEVEPKQMMVGDYLRAVRLHYLAS